MICGEVILDLVFLLIVASCPYKIWNGNKHFACYSFLNFTERLALIRQQRADAAKKREEEKAGNLLRFYL